jgi:adenylylsulfate kinase
VIGDEDMTKESSVTDHPSPVTRHSAAFAIWITGLPASGKSTIAGLLRPRLEALGLTVEVLESDEVRRVLTPAPTYSPEERDLFYRALAFTGQRLVTHGVTVVFDATATRRLYRDFARSIIPRFVEVAIDCPLEVCMERDRKGTYERSRRGETATVPGLQVPYEEPLNAELRFNTTVVQPQEAARQILEFVGARFLGPPSP